MSSWITEGAATTHNGAGYQDTTFMTPNAPSFDSPQFPNQRLQNGAMRNGSPAFNSNPSYQTNSVIPSKRPRETSLGTSPHQAASMLPNSRSQTPQQPYQNFPTSNGPPQHVPQQSSYAHLQNGSTNGSPSPIMGNPLARPGGVPQRVSTASPHPFSPAGQQQFATQPSPSQSDHGVRVDTPSNPYGQNPGFGQGFNPNFPPNSSGRSSVPPQTPMTPQQMQQMQQNQQVFAQQQAQQQIQLQAQQRATNDQQKMMYQMQMQAQMQQRMGQRPGMPQNQNPMAAKAQPQGPNGQMAQFAGGQPQQPSQKRPIGGPNPEQFMNSLRSFMLSKSLPLDENPTVEGRPIALYSLYMAGIKFGGFKKIAAANGWPQLAQALQFSPPQIPSAAIAIRGIYERYLVLFEEAWQQNQQQQRARQQQMARQNVMGQMSPTKQMPPQMQQSQAYLQQQQIMAQQLAAQQSVDAKIATPTQQPVINGLMTPHSQPLARNSVQRGGEGTPPQNGAFSISSPIPGPKHGSLTMPSPQLETKVMPPAVQDFKLPSIFKPKLRTLDTYGGLDPEVLEGISDALIRVKPNVPTVSDLGAIDIHALTMSIRCGIPGELRMALDTLATIVNEPRIQLDLRYCEDLLDSLIDSAAEQVDELAMNAAEVSDVMLINSYEEVYRSCKIEQNTLQDIPEFGSPEHMLDRTVDRLICITTILRNMSFFEANHSYLADEMVIKFLCAVIRHLGTRNMLLRSHRNTLDFMKDVITFLSNLAHSIELPGREQALCLLHFLLAFSPSPSPNSIGSESINFSPYDPQTHPYLPAAVDSLAKLLARDQPNRTFYKHIFASDATSTPPYDLLTKAFALTVSPVPDCDQQDAKRGSLGSLIEARKPILMQAMLAGEILSNLAPGFESGLASSWLKSDDGFALNLFRMVLSIARDTAVSPPPNQRAQQAPKGVDDEALYRITMGGLGILNRLSEKCKDPDDPTSMPVLPGMASKEDLMAALAIRQPRMELVLKQLYAYCGFDI